MFVLSEHWLWPYELHRLYDISSDYNAHGKVDSRLTEESERCRGSGGIGILWHKSIGAVPVSDISSDRICAIIFSVADDRRAWYLSLECICPV